MPADQLSILQIAEASEREQIRSLVTGLAQQQADEEEEFEDELQAAVEAEEQAEALKRHKPRVQIEDDARHYRVRIEDEDED